MQYIRNPDSIIFVPFETVTVIVRRFTNIQLNAQTIWNWVQVWGLGEKDSGDFISNVSPRERSLF